MLRFLFPLSLASHFIPQFKLSYFENTIQNTRLLSKLIIFYLNFINSIQNSNILRLKFQFCHLSKSRDNYFNSQQNSKIYYTKISLSKINIPIFQFLKFLKPKKKIISQLHVSPPRSREDPSRIYPPIN